jgi:hypothetical protein
VVENTQKVLDSTPTLEKKKKKDSREDITDISQKKT